MNHWFVSFLNKGLVHAAVAAQNGIYTVICFSFVYISPRVSICPHISGLKETPSKGASRTPSIAVKPQQYCYYVYYYCCCYYYYCCCYYYEDSRVVVVVVVVVIIIIPVCVDLYIRKSGERPHNYVKADVWCMEYCVYSPCYSRHV